MKKISMLVLLVSLSQVLFAQEDNNAFNIRIGAHGGGFGLGVGFDFAVTEDVTLGLITETMTLTSGTVTATSTGYGIGARYYFNGALQKGGYVNPYFIFGSVEGVSSSESLQVDASTIGALLGHQWMGDHFNADISIGMRSISTGAITTTGGADTTTLEEALNQVGVSLGFSIGYAF